METPDSHVVVDVDEWIASVRCTGEIDMVLAPRLRTAVQEAFALRPTCWIDLRAASFIDSSAVHQLLQALRYARALKSCLLIVTGENPAVMRPLEMLGLVPLLPLTDHPPVLIPPALDAQPRGARPSRP